MTQWCVWVGSTPQLRAFPALVSIESLLLSLVNSCKFKTHRTRTFFSPEKWKIFLLMQQKCVDMGQMETRGITVIWTSSNIVSLLSVPRNCFLYYIVISCNNIKNLEENILHHARIASMSVANWNSQGKIAALSLFSNGSHPTSSSLGKWSIN